LSLKTQKRRRTKSSQNLEKRQKQISYQDMCLLTSIKRSSTNNCKLK